jgi:hypothetical protein
MNMAVVNLGGSGTIYDPNLPARAAQQPQQQPQNQSVMPNTDQVDAPSAQQDNFPVPMDPGIASMLARAAAAPQSQTQQQAPSPLAPNYRPSFPVTGNYSPSPLSAPQQGPPQSPTPWFTSSNNPTQWGGAAPATPPARPRTAPSNTGPGGADVSGIFNQLPDNVFDGARNAPQTAQAPASATPQGWNLFAALGQALSHLLGFNAQGQPQGMTGLVKNPVQAAPSTAALRMPTPNPQQASRYQGRTLIG